MACLPAAKAEKERRAELAQRRRKRRKNDKPPPAPPPHEAPLKISPEAKAFLDSIPDKPVNPDESPF